jgi:DNA-binding transcriptional LysR family regulator
MARKLDSASARVFVAIAEEGSIGRAAARENIVPSAVSKRLGELEQMLGVTLVERGQHGVTLTPAGEALAHHSRMVLQAIERAHDELSEYVHGVRGHLRVRASASSLGAGLPSKIRSFLHTHPGVKIDLEELETPLIFREVLEGRADLGIGPDIFRPSELECLPYAGYELCVVAPRSHPLASRKNVSYIETLSYDQVEQNRGSVLTQLLDQAASRTGAVKLTRIRVRGFEVVCSMIAADMGVGVVPSFLNGRHRQLRFVPLSDDWAKQTIVMVAREFKTLPAAAQAFVEHLRHAPRFDEPPSSDHETA